MKNLKKLKLNQLSKAELEKKEQGYLFGGEVVCECYAGGTSVMMAIKDPGHYTPCICDNESYSSADIFVAVH